MTDLTRRQFGLGSVAAALAGCAAPSQAEPEAMANATVVRTTEELERAFRRLADGDTIIISPENAPYRTSQWLDIDANGVTVVGPGIRRLIVPADGADVGGVRIGHNHRCREVDLRWLGYQGNPEGQSPDAKRRHGIIVRQATDVTIVGNFVSRTHPYHEHNSGGSGISAERGCENVHISNNRIYDIGDRGIQLAGDRLVVDGNVVTDGYDRGISFDVPAPNGEAVRPRDVIVSRNLLGENSEGSLIGGGGVPQREDRGHFLVTNNAGYGHHKHFFHLGFDGRIGEVRVADNVSTQDADNGLAGVSVDINRAANVTIQDNTLRGYSGRGINVDGSVTDFTVAGNTITDPGAVGVRVVGGRDGTIASNLVHGADGAGFVIADSDAVRVNDNWIRSVGGPAIRTRDAPRDARNEISNNRVREYGQRADVLGAIVVLDGGNTVRNNHVRQAGTPAIVEGRDAGNNRFVDNWADGSSPWVVSDPTSVVRGNAPPLDVHRGLSSADGTVAVDFEKPYAERPMLSFGRREAGIDRVSYVTDDGGSYTGARIELRGDGVVDVFVRAAG